MENGKLIVGLRDGSRGELALPEQFAGFQGEAGTPSAVLLRHNDLHLVIKIDRTSTVGRGDAAGVADLVIESAITTIRFGR